MATQETEQAQTRPPRKRQARGERRMAELLDAAGQVFAECGYSATTTNAIAARAGVSPGTLYQYFPNKDAIADALGERFAEKARATQRALEDPELPGLELREVLDRVVDSAVDFNCAEPAFHVLLTGPDTPCWITEAHGPLHTAILDRVTALLAGRAPGLPEARLRRSALVAVQIFKGLLPLVLAAEGAEEEQQALVAELKQALHGYLLPVVEAGAADSPTTVTTPAPK
ncbi:TetR/AcrR family transcriptional regulator [Peterkaempfera bronchialis]|uniref:TetR/AcrR family transcriptional regulator n=1 Tax=Peterkaempfera bronchialis TaxID=2126346 RepID=A0A345T161_9ACTN|nr:TetR/AcrR family transcriptional regulator [Peterkaempfera bronchialis]AXI79716.1 TetR/AcrR family transcriptional regulator [Peterkaempfera bronchialis]